MKKLIVLMALLLVLAVPAQAASAALVDDADILTNSEEEALLQEMEDAATASGLDIVIVTVEDLDGQEPIDFADDYYNDEPYEVLLLVDMGGRQWWIEGRDDGADIFTESVIDSIGDLMEEDLTDGYYADAFSTFLDECIYYTDDSFDVAGSLLLALIVGLVVALIVTLVWRSKLKSVRFKSAAGEYVRAGSLNVTGSHDLYLYSNITRIRRQQNTSSSSSGSSRSGGGGRF